MKISGISANIARLAQGDDVENTLAIMGTAVIEPYLLAAFHAVAGGKSEQGQPYSHTLVELDHNIPALQLDVFDPDAEGRKCLSSGFLYIDNGDVLTAHSSVPVPFHDGNPLTDGTRKITPQDMSQSRILVADGKNLLPDAFRLAAVDAALAFADAAISKAGLDQTFARRHVPSATACRGQYRKMLPGN